MFKLKKEKINQDIIKYIEDKLNTKIQNVITIENYDFIFTPNDLIIRGFELIDLKSKNIVYNIFNIKNSEQVLNTFKNIFSEEKINEHIILPENKIFYSVAFFGLKDLRRFIYTEQLNVYNLFFNEKINALTAITILEEARYVNYEYELFKNFISERIQSKIKNDSE